LGYLDNPRPDPLFQLASVQFSPVNLLVQVLEEEVVGALEDLLSFKKKNVDEGLKYLGFVLKTNDYLFRDWIWLYNKIQ
jgi:hypothetical protein